LLDQLELDDAQRQLLDEFKREQPNHE
jgi:hypothetical protein